MVIVGIFIAEIDECAHQRLFRYRLFASYIRYIFCYIILFFLHLILAFFTQHLHS